MRPLPGSAIVVLMVTLAPKVLTRIWPWPDALTPVVPTSCTVPVASTA